MADLEALVSKLTIGFKDLKYNAFHSVIDEVYLSREEGLMWIKLTDTNGDKIEISCDLHKNMYWNVILSTEEDPERYPNYLKGNFLNIELQNIPMKSTMQVTKRSN